MARHYSKNCRKSENAFIILPMIINISRIFGYTGTGLILLAVISPMFLYRGKLGERYSLLNHFISELGELGVSRVAWIFNTGLLLAGLVMLQYVLGLGLAFGSVLGWLGTAAGIIAVLAVAAVGVFPMNNLTPPQNRRYDLFSRRPGHGLFLRAGHFLPARREGDHPSISQPAQPAGFPCLWSLPGVATGQAKRANAH
jgi:hypothetical protein